MSYRQTDVARLAGVSTATVSRVLNYPDRVDRETRDRVFGVIETLGYTPNFGARALASKRTNTVGAVIPTMENAIFARGLQSFQETLSSSGTTLLVSSSGYDADREAEQIRALIGRGADGILLIGSARSLAAIDLLSKSRIPHVMAWSIGQSSDNYVGFDNVAAAADLARKVIGLGHTRIAMIAGITEMNDRAASRVAGVRAAIMEAGLNVAGLDIVEARYSFDAARVAFDRLMAAESPPTAVICGNDVLAVGAISQAKNRGLVVPDDVSITGFDDIDIASVVEPALTTVHVPHRRMGVAAAEILLAMIEGRAANFRQILKTHIVERKSLASPRGQASDVRFESPG